MSLSNRLLLFVLNRSPKEQSSTLSNYDDYPQVEAEELGDSAEETIKAVCETLGGEDIGQAIQG